jgi:hypothetical protein
MFLALPVYDLWFAEFQPQILALLEQGKIGFLYPSADESDPYVSVHRFGSDPHLQRTIIYHADRLQAVFERDATRFRYLQQSGKTALEIATMVRMDASAERSE